MTTLRSLIEREIAQSGPISVQRYMELCLAHPQHGYYVTRDPLGADGDFTTAPEISQMFGEMIGTWIASVVLAQGQRACRLVELGPGRGTLMADALRVLGAAGITADIWLVETSPALRKQQALRVPGAQWADTLEAVPAGPVIVIANEFLDALPVRQYLCSAQGWRERRIGLSDGRLGWGLSGVMPGAAAATGAWREASPAADRVVDQIAQRLRSPRSAALIIDYGYRAEDRPKGPTLQAVSGHKAVDPLADPGKADLTWLIDFDHIARSLPSAQVTSQGGFLAQMGIGARAAALAGARPDQAGAVADALERLTAPAQMGTLFKVLGAVSSGMAPPPGFAEGS